MAEFSKQWCEAFDPEGMPWDFDILDEFNKLSESMYIPFICEGYGFIAIGKFEGKCKLALPNFEDNTVQWVNYDDVVKITN
jgi:hypothetical protein